ncbi:MAG: hypothetical protein GX162_13345 [Firmicutes bacterium]|jgi:hypothetical protein|nr:hypothetical protein [Bacillota bacterium]
MPANTVKHSYTASHTLAEEESANNMDVVFHRLLEVPRDSDEFRRLWKLLDTYLDAEIKQRSG